MTVYSKPAVRSAWGETAAGTDLTDPGNTYASAGWALGVKPPRQYMNWVLNYTFAAVRYICQTGVPAWDAAETYPFGATVYFNGILYSNGSAGNIGNAPSGSSAVWNAINTKTAPNGDNSVSVATTAFVHNNYVPLSASVGSLPGTLTNAQVPVGAVTQWQGALSIAGSQVSSAVAAANTLLINGGYRSIQWVGQLGQPSWLIGSNDGVNFLVWNPANFTVLNSLELNGFTASAGAVGNTIAQRDSTGVIAASYINQSSSNNENPTISQFMVTQGSDGFLRKASVAAVQSALGALTVGNFPASLTSNGYQKLPSGAILQWGTFTVANPTNDVIDVGITFPIAFTPFAVMVATQRSVGANAQAIHGSGFSSGYGLSGCIVTVDSSGGSVSTAHWFAIGFNP